MAKHEEFQKQVIELATGTLAQSEEAAVRAHMANCAACAGEFRRWHTLLRALLRSPGPALSPARIARIKVLARARREELGEHRWNRLVLTGLVVYGWALFLVTLPLLPTLIGWLGERLAVPWFVVVLVGLGLWWSFAWVIGLGLLPLLRQAGRVDLEEKLV